MITRLEDLVAESVLRHPKQTAVEYPSGQLTYDQLWRQALGLAAELRLRGVRRLALRAPSSRDSIALYLAPLSRAPPSSRSVRRPHRPARLRPFGRCGRPGGGRRTGPPRGRSSRRVDLRAPGPGRQCPPRGRDVTRSTLHTSSSPPAPRLTQGCPDHPRERARVRCGFRAPFRPWAWGPCVAVLRPVLRRVGLRHLQHPRRERHPGGPDPVGATAAGRVGDPTPSHTLSRCPVLRVAGRAKR